MNKVLDRMARRRGVTLIQKRVDKVTLILSLGKIALVNTYAPRIQQLKAVMKLSFIGVKEGDQACQ